MPFKRKTLTELREQNQNFLRNELKEPARCCGIPICGYWRIWMPVWRTCIMPIWITLQNRQLRLPQRMKTWRDGGAETGVPQTTEQSHLYKGSV